MSRLALAASLSARISSTWSSAGWGEPLPRAQAKCALHGIQGRLDEIVEVPDLANAPCFAESELNINGEASTDCAHNPIRITARRIASFHDFSPAVANVAGRPSTSRVTRCRRVTDLLSQRRPIERNRIGRDSEAPLSG